MSAAESVTEAVERLSRRDSVLKYVSLDCQKYTDSELAELADCLLAHPDVVTEVWMGSNRMTDKTGVKLARYLAASSTVEWLILSHNYFDSATYLALAAALRVNTSLQFLSLNANHAVDQARIDAAFVETLRLNPDRPADSTWQLYSDESGDFDRLKDAANQLGHPSLQMLLALHADSLHQTK